MIRKHLSIWFKALNCDSFVQETDWKISLEATAKKLQISKILLLKRTNLNLFFYIYFRLF